MAQNFKPTKFARKLDNNQVSRMGGFHFKNEKLQFFAVFQKLQPHCGAGYRCPIKMKLCQSHTLANRQLLWDQQQNSKSGFL